MLLGWRGLGSHMSVELHALWTEPFLVSRRSLRKKMVHHHSHLYYHYQMTNFSNFGEAVVDVPEIHGEGVGICCESTTSQESSSAVEVSRMGGRVAAQLLRKRISECQEESIRIEYWRSLHLNLFAFGHM